MKTKQIEYWDVSEKSYRIKTPWNQLDTSDDITSISEETWRGMVYYLDYKFTQWEWLYESFNRM